MSAPAWDYIAKLVCIGDSGTGKSSLTTDSIGVEFGSRVVPVGPPHSNKKSPKQASSADGAVTGLPDPPKAAHDDLHLQKHMKLSLWDTAGQETYKSVTRSYFRGASGALLVFDISRRQTFDHVTDWLHDLRQIAESEIVIVLVGNKSDLVAEDAQNREVTVEQAQEWVAQNNVLEYIETSAKRGDGVELAFQRVAERIYENIEAGRYDLNDRRSGVKGPSATKSTSNAVNLAGTSASSKGGCC